MIKTAVILTVYNRREITLQGLRTLYRAIGFLQKKQPEANYKFDIYMTDDGCTDGTGEAVKKEFPEVHIIQGDGTLYWSGGMRKAWMEASDKGRYDAFLWFNDDCRLYEKSLMDLVTTAEKHKWKSIVVGSMCDDKDHKKATYGGRNRKKVLLPPLTNNECTCTTFNGNLVLIPYVVFLVLGYNDSAYSHSLGDYDYGYRATECGISIYVPKNFQGECSRHSKPPIWCDPNIKLKKRIRNYYSPLGNPPSEVFHFEKKHFGIVIAFIHLLSNHLRLFSPRLWKNSF